MVSDGLSWSSYIRLYSRSVNNNNCMNDQLVRQYAVYIECALPQTKHACKYIYVKSVSNIHIEIDLYWRRNAYMWLNAPHLVYICIWHAPMQCHRGELRREGKAMQGALLRVLTGQDKAHGASIWSISQNWYSVVASRGLNPHLCPRQE